MNRRLLVCILILAMLLPGCIRQRPVLAAEATPAPTPTPSLPPVAQSLIPKPEQTDALGTEILGEDHFLRYLTFTDLRVYEYEGGTLFDGICKNDYPETLTGSIELVFTDKDGTVVARAPVYTRNGDNAFAPGETVLYVEIDTDMDIRMLPFSIIVTQKILPQPTMPAAEAQNNTIAGG
ncbi:MAG: hypothetical protein AAGU77_01920 [Bacillota bacterium]